MSALGQLHASLWRLGDDFQSLHEVTRVTKNSGGKRPPLLFIHGIEYAGAAEAMRDFVTPMLETLNKRRLENRDIYVFAWNSLLRSDTHIWEFAKQSWNAKFRLLFRELPQCATYLRDIEHRARLAAAILLPFALEWNSERESGPTVITHSMGSLVWAETLRLLADKTTRLDRPGIWWSLQPALPRDALHQNNDYAFIPRIYTGGEAAKAMIWYSRLDHILSTIYLVSKKTTALGQLGCARNLLPQRDITRWAREAHGTLHFSPGLGHFFKRMSAIIAQESEALNL